MKKLQQLFSTKAGCYMGMIILIAFLLAVEWVSNRSEPKITRQVGRSSENVQTLWENDLFFWDYVAEWDSNTINVIDPKTGKLLSIDGLTGETVWTARIPYGAFYLFAIDQKVFTVTYYVSAFRSSTGELLWTTKLGDGHVPIYAQEEGALLRIYYGDKIFEVSQESGEIISEQPKGDIVWIQNNVEVHCPLTIPQDEATQSCWIGLTGIDHVTGITLWKNNKAHYSEYYQERSAGNMFLVGFSEDGICLLDSETGGHNWCLPAGKISNFAVDNDRATGYFIRNDFSLVKINLLTGSILAETQFLPTVLPKGMERDEYGYRVVVTKNMVIVSFRDSNQTFGLKFNQ